jgi:hypothetical protein
LTHQQGRISKLGELRNLTEDWQRLAVDVASLAIRACATCVVLPEFQLPPHDSIAALFSGLHRTVYENTNEEFKTFRKSMEEYEQFKRRTMAVDKVRLVKLLRFSKKVIDLGKDGVVGDMDDA